MQRWHFLLGYGGLIPFLGLSLMAVFGFTILDKPSSFYLVPYAALIFSFIGGIYWAFTLTNSSTQSSTQSNPNNTLLLLVSVVLMLWAWLWMIVPGIPPSLMALSFWLLPVFEYFYLKQAFSAEFRLMRRVLSIFAGVSLATLCFV